MSAATTPADNHPPIHRQALDTAAFAAQFLDWRAEWTLHVAFMDADHRRLAQQLVHVAEAVSRRDTEPSDAHIIRALEHLALLTRRHFAREEEIMRAARYPHLDGHRNEHAALLGDCGALIADARAGRIDWSDPDLLPALEHWLVAHILDDDRLLARYLRRSGMASLAPRKPLTI
jgi:hemerythrin